MKGEAVLVSSHGFSLENDNIAKILHFFGVSSCALTVMEFLGKTKRDHEGSAKSKLFCSSDTFLELIRELEKNSGQNRPLRERVHSVFVYAAADHNALRKLATILIGNQGTVISQIDPGTGDFVVSSELDDFCGAIAGVRASTLKKGCDAGVVLNVANANAINIISLGRSAIFLKLEYKGVPVFLSTSGEIIDIDTELTSQNFDVREHFLRAVPVVLYIKWALAKTCWSAPEINACLVIDDPVLKRRHGFVDFQELLSLMKRHNFSTNIGFIPWNWRRSVPEVVQLFRENTEHYSLSVHGCDHTRAEFGSSGQRHLYWKTQRALERMNRHESSTGIRHDPVMVFPHGIFSEAAMSALKRTNLIAAVNNDLITADPDPRAITVFDVWKIAVMRYAFPLFTRRYPWEGIENFAFDALLGKPAIAVIHHDYCGDHCARLVDFVQRLNALQCAPTWRGLGDVVRRSCRQREASPAVVEVEMYGMELRIENRFHERKHFVIRKREDEPSAIEGIYAGSQEFAWKSVDDHICFGMDLNPGESRVIRMGFQGLAGQTHGDTLPYSIRAMVRRYLSEVRDNYVEPIRYRFAGSR